MSIFLEAFMRLTKSTVLSMNMMSLELSADWMTPYFLGS